MLCLITCLLQGEGEGLTPCDTTALLMDVVFSYVYSSIESSCSIYMCPVLQGMLGLMHVCLSVSVSVCACMRCKCMYFPIIL